MDFIIGWVHWIDHSVCSVDCSLVGFDGFGHWVGSMELVIGWDQWIWWNWSLGDWVWSVDWSLGGFNGFGHWVWLVDWSLGLVSRLVIGWV